MDLQKTTYQTFSFLVFLYFVGYKDTISNILNGFTKDNAISLCGDRSCVVAVPHVFGFLE